MKTELSLLVAGIACLITFMLVRRALGSLFKNGPVSLLAAAVGMLGFLGIATSSKGAAEALLAPYVALPVALLLAVPAVVVMRLLSRNQQRRGQPNHRHAVWRDAVPSSAPPDFPTGHGARSATGQSSEERPNQP